jgi:four helix bundle protein
MCDHEKLDVYPLELKFLGWATEFLVELADVRSPVNKRELSDQLDRASLSALLNTAEGNGRRQGKQRARFFDDARGSAFECAACLDASVAKKLSSVERIQPGKELLERIVAMLSKLVERFDPDLYCVREGDDALGEAEPIEDSLSAVAHALCRYPLNVALASKARSMTKRRRRRKDDDEYEKGGTEPHL